MKNYWVFGASKKLGATLVGTLTEHHRVTSFSRSVSPIAHANHTALKVDFSDEQATRTAIQDAISNAVPDGIVFCQRYRSTEPRSQFIAFKQGLDVELHPILLMLEALDASRVTKPVSIVLMTSVAGQLASADLPFHYQLLKATAISATRALAASYATKGVRINCVSFGEYEKHPRASYDAASHRKFEMVERFALGKRLCTPAELVNTVDFLLSDRATYLTGQIIGADGGLSNLAQESILRQLAAD